MSPLYYKFLWLSCFETVGGTRRTDGQTDGETDRRGVTFNPCPGNGFFATFAREWFFLPQTYLEF